ncbi:hypothetical protein J6590_047494 [Homalodisca vitripennis]|nr:hypothetical protein J6590_047494 [Homalodisca vitripennis]
MHLMCRQVSGAGVAAAGGARLSLLGYRRRCYAGQTHTKTRCWPGMFLPKHYPPAGAASQTVPCLCKVQLSETDLSFSHVTSWELISRLEPDGESAQPSAELMPITKPAHLPVVQGITSLFVLLIPDKTNLMPAVSENEDAMYIIFRNAMSEDADRTA